MAAVIVTVTNRMKPSVAIPPQLSPQSTPSYPLTPTAALVSFLSTAFRQRIALLLSCHYSLPPLVTYMEQRTTQRHKHVCICTEPCSLLYWTKTRGAGSLDRFFFYGYGAITYIIPISTVFALGFWDVYVGSLI